ncbi:MAG: c-type cytochrome [Pseudomonadota bacterium]|nr:c-type cytochrome [Pseudomonadota bacterium]
MRRVSWATASVTITAAVAVAAAITGFIWLPMMQTNTRFQGVWNAICSAAGVFQSPLTTEPVVLPTYRTTRVEVTPQMLHGASADAIGRGATLALRCAMCHGARGLSDANAPNLAGQYVSVIYKELQDYKSGARTNSVMTPLVADLTEEDTRDLAAYYAYLPRLPAYHPASAGGAPRIVASGAPMRNIAPCGACHGGLDNKAGSAWLDGQPAAYLEAQLQAFASGARHNDISEQMRNVARQMTPSDIEAATRYYASQP